MTENKPKADPLIPLMVEVIQILAKEEIKAAIKAGTLPIDIGMDDNFYKGVCFGIAITGGKLAEANEARKKKEQVKKN